MTKEFSNKVFKTMVDYGWEMNDELFTKDELLDLHLSEIESVFYSMSIGEDCNTSIDTLGFIIDFIRAVREVK